jgi:hypothetical protein
MTTESTESGLMLPDVNAAWEATTCKSHELFFTNFPPYVPKGVLLAATIKMPENSPN